MSPRALLLTLFSLLALAACTGAPATTPTVAPTVTPIPPTSTHTPILPTVTETALPPTETWTPSPVPPTRTPTQIPETWRMVVFGQPCTADMALCELSLRERSELYSVNNDKSAFALLRQTMPQLPSKATRPRFSPSGERLAYQDYVTIFILDATGAELGQFDVSQIPNIIDFDFQDETSLVLYRNETDQPITHVVLEKLCLGESAPQAFATVDFPTEPYRHRSYRISPQGDKLLAHVQYNDRGEASLYIQALGVADPPRRLFSASTPTCEDYGFQYIGAYQWHRDGEKLEFLMTEFCNGQAKNNFYEMDWRDDTPTLRFVLPGIVMGKGIWSPENTEFAFRYARVRGGSIIPIDGSYAGVYLLDFKTGTWVDIVSEFFVEDFVIWPVETVP